MRIPGLVCRGSIEENKGRIMSNQQLIRDEQESRRSANALGSRVHAQDTG